MLGEAGGNKMKTSNKPDNSSPVSCCPVYCNAAMEFKNQRSYWNIGYITTAE